MLTKLIRTIILFSLVIGTFQVKADEIPPNSILELIHNVFNGPEENLTPANLAKLAKYPMVDSFMLAGTRLIDEIMLIGEANYVEERAERVKLLIRFLTRIGRPNISIVNNSTGEVKMGSIESMTEELIKETHEFIDPVNSELATEIEELLKKMSHKIIERGGTLESYVELLEKKERGDSSVGRSLVVQGEVSEKDIVKEVSKTYAMNLERAIKLRKYLEENVIGQPELIENYYKKALLSTLYGLGREKPVVVYKMGQPGNGKDTSSEVYVDALFGKKGAHAKVESNGIERLFRMPILKSDADIWGVLGSTTGHVGSDGIPNFLKWLVKFSAGRYVIVDTMIDPKTGKKVRLKEPYIVENQAWEPGMVLDGYYPPEMGVVYLNEFHNWSKKAKDVVIKQALEKGYFPVNNPGEGVAALYVPIQFDIASNEGIGLLSSRDVNGNLHGEPKTIEESLASYEIYAPNKRALREEIGKTNTMDAAGERDQRGTSEEFLNRILDEDLILMRPIAPKDLQKILEIKFENLNRRLKSATGSFGTVELDFSTELIEAMQEYNYNAENNARPMEDRLVAFVEKSILDAIMEGKIKEDKSKKQFYLDIQKNEDKTLSLLFKDSKDGKVLIEQLVKTTLSNKENEPISVEELDELMSLGDRMTEHVFGVDHIVKAIAEAVILAEADRTNPNSKEAKKDSSKAFFLLGWTSTGKSETAKALARELPGVGEENLVSIDFNNVNTNDDMKRLFYGDKDSRGRVIPSEFMQEYDKRNGRVVFVFEEIANLALKGRGDLLMSLYDLLREDVVRSFVDNKPRSMKNVVVLMTGNAGKEWYEDIPKNIPLNELMEAMLMVYELANGDEAFKQATLIKYFTEAFAARVTMNRTFFYPPLNFKSLRQLTMNKLNKTIKDLRPSGADWGWDISFASEEDYMNAVEYIEEAGFDVSQQGASIVRFINDIVKANIKKALLDERRSIGIGEELALHFEVQENEKNGTIIKEQKVYLATDSGKKVKVDLPHRKIKPKIKIRKEDRILTAYHEAGHEVVRQVLLADKYEPILISIQPGVARMANKWVRYEGIAKYMNTEKMELTAEGLVREVAVYLAGTKAQEFVTEGGRHDHGKAEDIEGATQLIKVGILQLGLSPKWGSRVVKPNEIHELDEDSKKLLSEEINRILLEAAQLAEEVIESNFDQLLSPIALALSKAGTLDSKILKKFYREANGKIVYPSVEEYGDHNATLKDGVPVPEDDELADIEELVQAKKAQQVESVNMSSQVPIKKSKVVRLEQKKMKSKGKLNAYNTAAQCQALFAF